MRTHPWSPTRAAGALEASGEFACGATFGLGEYQEDYSTANPAFTGGWTRSAWAPASDGYESVASAAGAQATFTFTGSSVAWIATKATNRGVARVFLDGVQVKRDIDLYSDTTVPQAVAYTFTWPEVGPHTIQVQVLGTPGRPKVDVDAFVRLR